MVPQAVPSGLVGAALHVQIYTASLRACSKHQVCFDYPEKSVAIRKLWPKVP